MNKIEFSKLSTKEDMILAFNQLKDDYRQLFAINEDLQEENERLKKLCDKYEEEHNTEFKIWKDERYQLLDIKSRNEKAIEYIHKNYYEVVYKTKGTMGNDLLNILGGDE